jgi:SAM-dependent methyltransferase
MRVLKSIGTFFINLALFFYFLAGKLIFFLFKAALGGKSDALHSFGKKLKIYPRKEFIIRYCTGKDVVHFGFLDYPYTEERMNAGTLLHQELKAVCGKIAGVDIEAESADIYHKKYPSDVTVIGDIKKNIKKLKELPCDVIVLAETLEHVENDVDFLRDIREMMKKDTRLLLTVPNAVRMDGFLASLMNVSLVHPDHLREYPLHSLVNLIENHAGMKVEEIAMGWYGLKVPWVSKVFPMTAGSLMLIVKMP